MPFDPSLLDAGTDAGPVFDADVRGASVLDASTLDASVIDAGALDAGAFDAGSIDSRDAGGLWGLCDDPTKCSADGKVDCCAHGYVRAQKFDYFEVTVSRFRRFVNDYDRWRAASHPAPVKASTRT